MQETRVPQDKAPKPTSSLSLTSMIMGVLGWTLVPIVGGIIAVITGHMAKKEIRQSNGLLGGDGIATAGLILGYSNLTLGLCVCLALILFPAIFAGVWMYGDRIFNTIP
jgi:phosphate/sulfate permease